MTNSLYSLIQLKIVSQIKSTLFYFQWIFFTTCSYHAYMSALKNKQKGKRHEKWIKIKER